ncbi:ATP-binding protein [Thioclava sp. GXIMD4216]|uniref:ATP-binding protein n=1 Tax=Thioclava sp. GXIMD4216 TaxID=3131929 RepID=UPI0030CEC272
MRHRVQLEDRLFARPQIRNVSGGSYALLGACLALCACVLLGGYVLDIALLRQLAPGWPAMVPQTAYALLFLALAQGGLLRGIGRGPVLVTLVLALAMAGIGIEDQLHTLPQTQIRRLSLNPLVTSSTGRMAPATIAGVLLMVAILALQMARAKWCKWGHAALASFGIFSCLIAMDAYFFDAPALSRITFLSAMAFHTALGFFLLYVAALLASPEGSWVPDLFTDLPGGRMARWVLPWAVIGPIALCYVALRSTEHGLISPNLRLSSLAIVLLLLAAVATLRGARYQNIAARRAVYEERRLREVLDGLETAVFVIDAQGVLRMVNHAAEKMAANAPDTFLQTAEFHSMRNRRPLEGDEHPVTRLLAQGGPTELHCGWIDGSGREHALRLSVTRTHPGQGFAEPVRILAIQDQTEGWILRENLSRTERLDAIGQMAGGVAHEMANILGAARLSVDTLLLKPEELSETQRGKITAIRTVCERGADLTERLLNLTRDRAAEDETLRLDAKLREVADLARQTVPAAIRFDLDLGCGDLFVRCVPRDLESALLNLVLNASHAIMEGPGAGGITLRSHACPDGRVAISVIDTGPGMSAALLEHVREPFYTTREAQGGTGLGLPMVDNFARQSNGLFELRSTEGEGTTATLVLGVVSPADAEAAPPQMQLPDLGGLRVLVVEDDPHFHDILTQSLQMLSAEVLSASSAAQALDILARQTRVPDLLITDIMLPNGLDGYRLAFESRKIWPDLRVIYMSGYTDQISRSGRSVQGLLLRKPLALDNLVNAIALTLHNRPGDGPGPSAP